MFIVGTGGNLQRNKKVGYMQFLLYKHSGETGIFLIESMSNMDFLYKSFNTKIFKNNNQKKKKRKSRREPGHCDSEGKVYEFHFFSVGFCTGTPWFPCFDVLTGTKSSTPAPKRRVSQGFCKEYL